MANNTSYPTINAGRLKHLEMLQQIITRMASNSFLVKGWSVTLLSAILVLIVKDKVYSMVWVAIVPVLAFWMLDGFFLRQERLFRKLYDYYRTQPQDSPTDFSMNTSIVSKEVASWLGVMFSRTLVIFYGCLSVIVVVVLLLSHNDLL